MVKSSAIVFVQQHLPARWLVGMLVPIHTSIDSTCNVGASHYLPKTCSALRLTAGIVGTADGVADHVLPSIQDSPLIFTQDIGLRHSLIHLGLALVQSLSPAITIQQQSLLRMLLELRAGVLLANSCEELLQEVCSWLSTPPFLRLFGTNP